MKNERIATERVAKEKPAGKTIERIQKTYGVKGLMEWRLPLPTGSSAKKYIEIVFEGGQITGYGVAPARYSTDDPYIQHLIESSHWYDTGRIRLLR